MYRYRAKIGYCSPPRVTESRAHWATAHAIDEIEGELKVNVMTSQQAIFWKALRTAGVNDKIPGFGRLLREF